MSLEELRELSLNATAGPWEAEAVGSEGYHVFGARNLDGTRPLRRSRVAVCTWGSFESDKADALFLAAAANHVRDLFTEPGGGQVAPSIVILYAIRYGLGRATNAHEDALTLIRTHWALIKGHRRTIRDDVDHAARCAGYPDVRKSAADFLVWMDAQP